MNFLMAFLIGGAICAIGQLILELFKLTPGHITCLFVIFGSFLELGNIYDKLIRIAGAGALLPITSFGHSLAHSAYEGAKSGGVLGLLGGVFDLTTTGIVAVIVLSVIIGLIFKPKG